METRYKVIINKAIEYHVDTDNTIADNDIKAISKALTLYRSNGYISEITHITCHIIGSVK